MPGTPDRNPDRLEIAIDALLAKIVAEEPLAAVDWILDDAEPLRSDQVSAADAVTPTKNQYLVTVIDGDGSEARPLQTSQRFQTVNIALRTYLYERTAANLGQSLVRHIRKVQDWIETFNQHARGRGSWWIDWTSWSSIRDDSGRAPTPGVRILLAVHVHQ
jgi:hypothetical protein